MSRRSRLSGQIVHAIRDPRTNRRTRFEFLGQLLIFVLVYGKEEAQKRGTNVPEKTETRFAPQTK